MKASARTITLLGGGRWARVHASNLVQLLAPGERVLWASKHNQDALRATIAGFPEDGPTFELLPDLEGALALRPTAALVVGRSDLHGAIARACLLSGAHTFVEKPLAFDVGEAQTLINLAAAGKFVLAVGLHLLSASYLKHFKQLIEKRDIAEIAIAWFDPDQEVRYGEVKSAHVSTPIAHDLYPHIWSIIRVLTGHTEPVVLQAASEAPGSISFVCSAASIKVVARCGRHAERRVRRIDVTFRDGGTASLDFTEEPGTALLDGAALPPDPMWGKVPRPVMMEVRDFLKMISSSERNADWPHLASQNLGSVAGAQALNARLAGTMPADTSET